MNTVTIKNILFGDATGPPCTFVKESELNTDAITFDFLVNGFRETIDTYNYYATGVDRPYYNVRGLEKRL